MFGKKKDKKNQEDKNEVTKAEYKVIIVEKLGGTVREIKTLDAVRFRDDEDHVVYLKNDKQQFLEIFPQQINDFKNYTESEVDKLLHKYENQLQNERVSDNENINDKDLEYNIMKLKAKKRSFKFSDNASYLSFDQTGRPTFIFLREGSTFHPLKWDTETKSIFTPSDNRKKSATISLRNKQNKYNKDKLIGGATFLLLVVGFIMISAGAYMLYKANTITQESFNSYEESKIAQAQRQCLENINQVSKSISNTAKDVESISKSVSEDLNKPQTVINGVIPE